MSGDIDGAFSEIIAAEEFDNVDRIVALYEDPPAADSESGPTPPQRWMFKPRLVLGCIALIVLGWIAVLVVLAFTVIAAL